MAKLLKLTDSITFVLDKISAVDISGDKSDEVEVRVFMPGVLNGYIVKCTNSETANECYNRIIKALEAKEE